MLASCLGAEHPCLDDARLLASEAASNALTHSASAAPVGHFAVAVEWTSKWVMVSVSDQGANSVPYRLRAEPYDISGRGVDLIDQLAECWGFTRRRTTETRLWFELSATRRDLDFDRRRR
jgi:anti-sigma regulatory factor (Ser/Thr protein kinase)